MTIARTRFVGQLTSAILLSGALIWMLAPTFPIARGVDPVLVPEGLTTMHSWGDPFVSVGSGLFMVPAALLCATVAVIGSWYAVATRATRRLPAWWALAAAALAGVACVIVGVHLGPVTAIVLLLAGSATSFYTARRALPAIKLPEPTTR